MLGDGAARRVVDRPSRDLGKRRRPRALEQRERHRVGEPALDRAHPRADELAARQQQQLPAAHGGVRPGQVVEDRGAEDRGVGRIAGDRREALVGGRWGDERAPVRQRQRSGLPGERHLGDGRVRELGGERRGDALREPQQHGQDRGQSGVGGAVERALELDRGPQRGLLLGQPAQQEPERVLARRGPLVVLEREPDPSRLGHELHAAAGQPRGGRAGAGREREAPPVDELEPGRDAPLLDVGRARGRAAVRTAQRLPGVDLPAVELGPLERPDGVARDPRPAERHPLIGQRRLAGQRPQLRLPVDERLVDEAAEGQHAVVPLPAPAGAVGLLVGGEHDRQVDVGEAGEELAAAEAGPRVDGRAGLAAGEDPPDRMGDGSIDERPEMAQRRSRGGKHQPLRPAQSQVSQRSAWGPRPRFRGLAQGLVTPRRCDRTPEQSHD